MPGTAQNSIQDDQFCVLRTFLNIFLKFTLLGHRFGATFSFVLPTRAVRPVPVLGNCLATRDPLPDPLPLPYCVHASAIDPSASIPSLDESGRALNPSLDYSDPAPRSPPWMSARVPYASALRERRRCAPPPPSPPTSSCSAAACILSTSTDKALSPPEASALHPRAAAARSAPSTRTPLCPHTQRRRLPSERELRWPPERLRPAARCDPPVAAPAAGAPVVAAARAANAGGRPSDCDPPPAATRRWPRPLPERPRRCPLPALQTTGIPTARAFATRRWPRPAAARTPVAANALVIPRRETCRAAAESRRLHRIEFCCGSSSYQSGLPLSSGMYSIDLVVCFLRHSRRYGFVPSTAARRFPMAAAADRTALVISSRSRAWSTPAAAMRCCVDAAVVRLLPMCACYVRCMLTPLF